MAGMIQTSTWSLTRIDAMLSGSLPYSNGQVQYHDEQHLLCLTVMTDDRVGKAVLPVGAGEEQISDALLEQALLDAAQHVPRGKPGTGLDESDTDGSPALGDLLALDWLEEIGDSSEKVEFSVRHASGDRHRGSWQRSWVTLGKGDKPFARVPASAALNPAIAEPDTKDGEMLLPPWILGEIFLETLSAALTSQEGLAKWPSASLVDPAWGRGVDMEGTARRPVTFSRAGCWLARATDARTRLSAAGETTGHAGAGGPHIRDLVVGPNGPTAPFPRSAKMVSSGALLGIDAGGRNAVVALRTGDGSGAGERAKVVGFSHLADLMDSGSWCGPWQRGPGPWTSRWLAVPDDVLRTRTRGPV
ncbi:hypothetical protein [Streptomyces canus]|uniref:Uncharacterized protein n=1 Tax=Streptomyces canus TaxID=58343 RepID=A0AAW8F9U2_9ACTN|nr:hypothetical protein [Streptomyces canus]MDQ0764961.1 hypothetical protein [Streptomyces canus]MDQ0906583.1 hypothetical protein [Streptomyces canus]MDQ1066603.1 hypothetical protein [Streptomyces canus]